MLTETAVQFQVADLGSDYRSQIPGAPYCHATSTWGRIDALSDNGTNPSQATPLLRDIFGQGIEDAKASLQAIKDNLIKRPPGLTDEHLRLYERLALTQIQRGKDLNGAQAIRLQILSALRGL